MRRHLTYANVVATLALVVAVGGGSTAIAISAKKAPKNSVTSAAIRDGSVTGKDLAAVRVESQVVATQTQRDFAASPASSFSAAASERHASQLNGFGPTADGNGFRRVGGTGGGVTVTCLKASPGSNRAAESAGRDRQTSASSSPAQPRTLTVRLLRAPGLYG